MNDICSIFKILSNQTRLEILLKLYKNGEMSCKQISLKFRNLTQPTLSHHFKVLENAKLILVKKVSTEHFYSLNLEKFLESGVDLSKMIK